LVLASDGFWTIRLAPKPVLPGVKTVIAIKRYLPLAYHHFQEGVHVQGPYPSN
jgi:hypothetical protein